MGRLTQYHIKYTLHNLRLSEAPPSDFTRRTNNGHGNCTRSVEAAGILWERKDAKLFPRMQSFHTFASKNTEHFCEILSRNQVMLIHYRVADSTGGNLPDIRAAVNNEGNFMLGGIEVEDKYQSTYKWAGAHRRDETSSLEKFLFVRSAWSPPLSVIDKCNAVRKCAGMGVRYPR